MEYSIRNGIFVKSSLTGEPEESFLTHFFSTLLSMALFFHNGEQPNFLAFFRAFMRIAYSFRKGRISMRSQNPLNKLRVYRMLCCISTRKHSNALPFAQHLWNSLLRNLVECVARDCNCQITFVHISSQTLFRCHSQLVWSHCPTFRERVMFAIFLAKAIFYIYCQFYYPSLRQSYSAEKSFGPSAVQFAASLYPFAGKLELMSFLSVAPSQKRALKMAGKGGRAALSPLPLSSPSSFRDKK